MAAFFDFVASIFLFAAYTANSAQITGWVYADNWFELYFNGEKVATDPLTFYPHNAVYINFTAPDTGLYSFAFKAKDFANDSTGLEPRQGPGGTDVAGWCLGDGGIYIALSDGTVTSSDWKCTVLMEGPTNSACTGITECLDKALQPSICSVTWNSVPSCWNQTVCAEADSWSVATEYDGTTVGWGRPPDATGYGYSYPDICGSDPIYTTEGCKPADKNWGAAKPIWTADLDFHNRILCRYSYCVGGGTDCTATNSPTTASTGTDSPTTSTPTTNVPSSAPTPPRPLTSSPVQSPTSSPSGGPLTSSPTVGTLTSSPSASGLTSAPSASSLTSSPTSLVSNNPTSLPTLSPIATGTDAPTPAGVDPTGSPTKGPSDAPSQPGDTRTPSASPTDSSVATTDDEVFGTTASGERAYTWIAIAVGMLYIFV